MTKNQGNLWEYVVLLYHHPLPNAGIGTSLCKTPLSVELSHVAFPFKF
uniref:Uncharacterized protein n=1 Tax=Anguilla anguilla TaxID=7936 RepID=A0A0E9SGK5_ANGAN